jgi:hypothetical protein
VCNPAASPAVCRINTTGGHSDGCTCLWCAPGRRYQGYYYYTRTEEGQQYALHCRRRVPAGLGAPTESDAPDVSQPEEVMLDENKRKEEGRHSFYMVGRFGVSGFGELPRGCLLCQTSRY